jgi:membrane fusion protein (multidrug efflux system)
MSDANGAASKEAAMATKGKVKKTQAGTRRIVIVLVLLAAAAVAGYFYLAAGGSQSTDDASVMGNQVVISSQMLAQIASMTVDERDPVAKGQVLVRLDDLTLRAQEKQSVANREYAEQNAALARLKLDQAQSDFQRATVQLKNRIIPQEQYDHLAIALSSARTQYQIALAQVKVAEAQINTVETSLARAVIQSPIDGVVAKKWTMPGNVVQPAQPIYTLYDLKNLWVEANFKETQVHLLRQGDPVVVTVDAFPGRGFTGKVESIGVATASEFALIPPDNTTGNFTKVTKRIPVKISLDNPDPPDGQVPVPGMSAEVRVDTRGR